MLRDREEKSRGRAGKVRKDEALGYGSDSRHAEAIEHRATEDT